MGLRIVNCVCGQQITWLLTKNKKKMPVHYETLSRADLEEIGRGYTVMYNPQRHQEHWSKCPNNKHFKKSSDKTQKEIEREDSLFMRD